jgi:hypothetical protein
VPATFQTENPFATARVRPGTIPFLFTGQESATALVERLAANGWRGEIVGPHGAGKSALLASLIPVIEAGGRRTLLVELHDRQRRLPRHVFRALREKGTGTFCAKHPKGRSGKRCLSPFPALLVVDGYEQLSVLSRFRLKWFCRRRGLGLLVTSHAPVGLPELFRVRSDPATVWRLVDELQRSYPYQVTGDEVLQRLARHEGNVRETLFDLYDLYESRRRSSGASGTAAPGCARSGMDAILPSLPAEGGWATHLSQEPSEPSRTPRPCQKSSDSPPVAK